MDDLLKVGEITSPHGVHGEVKVYPTTDDVKRFSKLKECILETKQGQQVLHVRSVKYQKNLVILGFKEFTTMNEVETLRKCPLLVTRQNAVKLAKDEYFIADLIGLNVETDIACGDGTLGGELKDVMQTGANDVYVIELEDGRELLLPAIKDCVLNVDIRGGVMKVHVLPGLLDDAVRA